MGWAAKYRIRTESGLCQSPNPMPVLFHPLVNRTPVDVPKFKAYRPGASNLSRARRVSRC